MRSVGVCEVFYSVQIHLKNQCSNLALKIGGHFNLEPFPDRKVILTALCVERSK